MPTNPRDKKAVYVLLTIYAVIAIGCIVGLLETTVIGHQTFP